MLLFTPIIFAAIPTHTSLCAVKVSSKSWAVCKSAAVAGSDFNVKNIGSCTSSLIILKPHNNIDYI